MKFWSKATALLAVALISLAIATPTAAERLSFALDAVPTGHLAMGDTVDIDLSLGKRFARIDAVELVITGEQQLGSGYDLNSPGVFDIAASVSAVLLDGAGQVVAKNGPGVLPGSTLFADHAVMIDRGTGFPPDPPGLDVLADGEALLRVGSAPLLFLGTTVISDLPVINITSATLIIDGVVVPEPGGAMVALTGLGGAIGRRRR